jgi:hypothetical protein
MHEYIKYSHPIQNIKNKMFSIPPSIADDKNVTRKTSADDNKKEL